MNNSGPHPYLVVGDIIIDMIMKAKSAPPPGGEIVTNNTSFRLGGSGCNTAVCFSKLGNKVSLTAHLGTDPFGTLALSKMQETTIDPQFIEIKEENQSGFFFIFVEENAQRTMYGNRGTNIKPVPFDKIIPKLRQFYGLHVSGYSLIDKQQEASIWKIFQAQEADHLIKSIDPGYHTIQAAAPTLLKYLPFLDFILMSSEELDCWRTDTDEASFIQSLLDQGVKNIIIKRGASGSEWFSRSTHFYSPGLKHEDLPVLGTTGAGDCFNAGFLFGHSHHLAPSICLLLGNLTAFLSITSPFGLESMRLIKDFPNQMLAVSKKVCTPEQTHSLQSLLKISLD